MLVSYNWLKDYVDINISPEELAHKLTMVGLEVSAIIKNEPTFENIVVGSIVEIDTHPSANTLALCFVEVGDEQPLRVVCGAPNIQVGQRVPVAKPGAVLAGGDIIGPTEIQGVLSEGMICSLGELGIETPAQEQEEGVYVLPGDTKIGAGLYETLGMDDTVIEIDLTPNRPDCLSVVNIAREAAAICNTTVRHPLIEVKEGHDGHIKDLISVEIIDDDLCGRYVARAVKGVKIAPSPSWLQNRLSALGVRPINNVVDVTNYVMLEMGQPLHAFDHRFLEGHQIVVRRAKPQEKMITLDGQERILKPDYLVIADGEKAVAVAGIMGGENSEVVEDTTTVLIESANFDPTNIRRTSRGLGLRSESSLRFEKGVDIEGALDAANRAAQLIALLGGGEVVRGVVDQYPGKWKPAAVKLRTNKVNELLGTDLTTEHIRKLLASVDFKIHAVENEIIEVIIPSFRHDVGREIDLVEEVARLYGYDKIPTSIPGGDTSNIQKDKKQIFEERCREILIACGLGEVITFSFMNAELLDKMNIPSDHLLRNAVEISNPLSEDQGIMRTSILPNLLDVARRNVNRRVNELKIFEIGNIFIPLKPREQPKEEKVISGLVMGTIDKTWNSPPLKMDFYLLKGILDELFNKLGVENVSWCPSDEYPGFHPGRTAKIRVGEGILGVAGQVHPVVGGNFGLKSNTYVFQLDFDFLEKIAVDVKPYKPLPRYPSASRDIAFVVSEDVPYSEIEETIKETGGETLSNYRLFDVYKGEQIDKGKKSMAYSLTYQAGNRTLTDKEVDSLHSKIEKELSNKFGAELR